MPKLAFRYSQRGFTLVELLVVIAIIAILAAVVLILINPVEIMRRSRDSTRLSDMEGLQKAIQIGMQDNAGSMSSFLCKSPATPPCSGTSNGGTSIAMRKNDGTGWVKVNLAASITVNITTLPLDPTNDSTYHYTYSSDGNSYEFNAVLESNQYSNKMANDGGNNNNAYEVGSSLTIIN